MVESARNIESKLSDAHKWKERVQIAEGLAFHASLGLDKFCIYHMTAFKKLLWLRWKSGIEAKGYYLMYYKITTS